MAKFLNEAWEGLKMARNEPVMRAMGFHKLKKRELGEMSTMDLFRFGINNLMGEGFADRVFWTITDEEYEQLIARSEELTKRLFPTLVADDEEDQN